MQSFDIGFLLEFGSRDFLAKFSWLFASVCAASASGR